MWLPYRTWGVRIDVQALSTVTCNLELALALCHHGRFGACLCRRDIQSERARSAWSFLRIVV